jgi:hypothetical protein
MQYVKLLDNPIEYTEILNDKSNFVIVSYFWGKNNVNKNSIKKLTYGQQVERLISNCRKFSVNYYIAEYPVFEKSGSYQIALGLKGHFITKCSEKFAKTIAFVDSDLQLLRYPEIFEIDADCFFVNWNEYQLSCYNPYQVELPGGILGFGNTFGAKTLLHILNEFMLKHLHLAEDKSFSGVISRHFMNTYLRCVWIPANYLHLNMSHIYNPSIGEYTHIASLNEDLKAGGDYKLKDIVFLHEDFETGDLDDVFQSRITKNRWPYDLYRKLGQKLRCETIKYLNYTDFNLNQKQLIHYEPDFKMKERENVIKNLKIPKLEKLNEHLYKIYSSINLNNTGPIIISLYSNTQTSQNVVDNFVNKCKMFNFNYLIYRTKDVLKINKPILFYKLLNKYKSNICYLDINYLIKKNPQLINVKNMDFMTLNLDNTSIDGYLCSDIRILRTLNDNLYFFAYNNVVLEFLRIWASFNKNLKYQHKNLEYAFNISIAINKLRCYWFSKDYILGPILTFPKNMTFSFFNNTYGSLSEKFKKLTKSLQVCGIKPDLKNGEPTKAHYYGSKNGNIYHNHYGKQFLEF